MPSYNKLIKKLRELCDNKSELSGDNADWQSDWKIEPHHIQGRIGALLIDPFNIILVTRTEHDIEEGKIKPIIMPCYGKEKLLAVVKDIRIKQRFIPND